MFNIHVKTKSFIINNCLLIKRLLFLVIVAAMTGTFVVCDNPAGPAEDVPVGRPGELQGNFLIDDFDDGNIINNLGFEWYCYDDNLGTNENNRPQAEYPNMPSVINVPYELVPRHSYGNMNDNFLIKQYTFTLGEENGNKYATIPFTMGERWWFKDQYVMDPWIGMGTILAGDGSSIDLSGAIGISFRIRAHNYNFLTTSFRVEQLDINDWAHYQKNINLNPVWTYDTVYFKDLTQPSWGEMKPFTINRITGLNWEIKCNPYIVDTIDIDDLEILYIPNTPTLLWPSNGGVGIPLSTTLLWKPVAGAETYTLEVSKYETFADLYIENIDIKTTFQNVSLNVNTTYYWRVKTVNKKGQSDWSAVRSFTTTK